MHGMVFMVLFLLYQMGISQSSPVVPGWQGGARSMGLANIYTVTSSGVDGLVGNPAGLTILNGSMISFHGRALITGKADWDDAYYQDMYSNQDISYSSGLKFYPKVMNLAVAFPVQFGSSDREWVGAIGYRNFYDISAKEKTEISLANLTGSGTETTNTQKGLLNYLTLAMAGKLKENVSLGVSMNLPFVKGYKLEEKQVSEDYTDSYKEEWKISGGTFLQVGGLWNATDKLDVGASVVLGHSYKIKNGKWTRVTNDNSTSGTMNTVAKVEMPMNLAVGAYYYLNPSLGLLVEYQTRPWEEVVSSLESGHALRIGVEYQSSLSLRAGFEIDRIPQVDYMMDGVNARTVTVGVGYQTGNLILDGALAYRSAAFDDKINDKVYEYKLQYLYGFVSAKYIFDFQLNL